MMLFVLAVVVALLGVGLFDLYNPGGRDVSLAGHHFVALSNWVPIALGAAAPLSLFLLHALWTSVRIGLLKRSVRRARMLAPVVVRRAALRPAPRPPAAAPPPMPRSPMPPTPMPRSPMPPSPMPLPPMPRPPSSGRRRRASQVPPRPLGPLPAPKRSWLPPRD